VTKRNQTCKKLTLVTVVNLPGNMTASMCTNYYGGGHTLGAQFTSSYRAVHTYILL